MCIHEKLYSTNLIYTKNHYWAIIFYIMFDEVLYIPSIPIAFEIKETSEFTLQTFIQDF